MSVRWGVMVVVAACGGKPVPHQPVIKTAEKSKIVASVAACIQPIEEGTAITNVVADEARVSYCIGGNADQCFALDTATGGLEHLPGPPEPAALATAHVETTNPDLTVCRLDTCKSLTPKVLPTSARLRAATNSEGSTAVVLLGDAQAGKGYAEIWDVAAARRVATFRYARGEFKCGDVAILDDTIYVSASTCGAPAARAALYSLRGRKLANVGGKDFGVYGNAHAQVDTKVWAFLEESGHKIAIQNLTRGKLVKTIDTSALFERGGAHMGNPGESAIVRIGSGKLAVIGGAPATGQVAVVDVETGGVQVIGVPVCGAR